tara:strand:- start:762 stop:905 length:144 start_codon:yes stop_codon:yes gene_type:complete
MDSNFLIFEIKEIKAYTDLIAGCNQNGIPYKLSKDERGLHIEIFNGY